METSPVGRTLLRPLFHSLLRERWPLGGCIADALSVSHCGSQHGTFLQQEINKCGHLIYQIPASAWEGPTLLLCYAWPKIMATSSSLIINKYLRRTDTGLNTEGTIIKTTNLVSVLTEDYSRREHMKMVLGWQG